MKWYEILATKRSNERFGHGAQAAVWNQGAGDGR